ncbi:MAG: hypothetical protein QOH60_4221, partial [Mycobacterium sp.]|nr:hypothetical protein [Mycobacterium sp.]
TSVTTVTPSPDDAVTNETDVTHICTQCGAELAPDNTKGRCKECALEKANAMLEGR